MASAIEAAPNADYECGAQSLDCRSPPRRSPVLACRHVWPEVGDVLLLGRIGRQGLLRGSVAGPGRGGGAGGVALAWGAGGIRPGAVAPARADTRWPTGGCGRGLGGGRGGTGGPYALAR